MVLFIIVTSSIRWHFFYEIKLNISNKCEEPFNENLLDCMTLCSIGPIDVISRSSDIVRGYYN